MGMHNGPSNPLPLSLTIAFIIVALLLDLWMAKRLLDDLYRPDRRVVGGDKTMWAVIILFGSILGMMAYVLFGREN
jgi:hypothetical protein